MAEGCRYLHRDEHVREVVPDTARIGLRNAAETREDIVLKKPRRDEKTV